MSQIEDARYLGLLVAGTTRLELATSGVTGRRSNQTELRPRWAWTTFPHPRMVGGTGFEPVTPGL